MEELKNKAPERGRLLTVAQAARMVGVTENALRYQLRIGNITEIKNTLGKIRVSETELLNKYKF
mgnify:FL=1